MMESRPNRPIVHQPLQTEEPWRSTSDDNKSLDERGVSTARKGVLNRDFGSVKASTEEGDGVSPSLSILNMKWRKPWIGMEREGECCFCGERTSTIRTGIVATKGPKHPFPRKRDN